MEANKAFKHSVNVVPETEDDWRQITKGFQSKWDFPNCLGALDGKHIAIQAPSGEGSMFYNYKNFHSIILLALVDSKYRFTYVDLGANGRAGDASVFRASPLFERLENGTLHIPPPQALPGTNNIVPQVIVADDAFPLKSYLLKPYPGERHEVSTTEARRKRIFDYRLSRARRCAENAFGILVQRFGILQTTISLEPDKASTVALATVALHNFLIENNDMTYGSNIVRPQANPLVPIEAQAGNRNSFNARTVRDTFCDYFNNSGAVHWQYDLPDRR